MQLSKLFVSVVHDLSWPTSLTSQEPLIPSLRVSFKSFGGAQITKATVMLVKFQMHPTDVVPISAALNALLHIFPKNLSRAQPAHMIKQSRRREHVDTTISLNVELLLVRIRSAADPDTVSAQLCLNRMAVSSTSGAVETITQATLQSLALIDKRAVSACFRAPLVIGMRQDVMGLDIKLCHVCEIGTEQGMIQHPCETCVRGKRHFCSFQHPSFAAQSQTLTVQSFGISCIFIYRFLADLLQFFKASQEAVPTSLLRRLESEGSTTSGNPRQSNVNVLMHFSSVSIIVPETGWSSSMLVLNADLIEIQPRANGRTLRNHVQGSLKESAPTHWYPSCRDALQPAKPLMYCVGRSL